MRGRRRRLNEGVLQKAGNAFRDYLFSSVKTRCGSKEFNACGAGIPGRRCSLAGLGFFVFSRIGRGHNVLLFTDH